MSNVSSREYWETQEAKVHGDTSDTAFYNFKKNIEKLNSEWRRFEYS